MTIVVLITAISSLAQVTGTFTDSRDGKTYKTVVIGTQTWMAENLAYKTGSGCWAYDNDQRNITTFGYLYSWEMAKNVCPTGWHLPNNVEWNTLKSYIGGIPGTEDVSGGKLKETDTIHWRSPNTGANNETGFTALPGGVRDPDETFSLIGYVGWWWTPTEVSFFSADENGYMIESKDVMTYLLLNNSEEFTKSAGLKSQANSVRCIKDN